MRLCRVGYYACLEWIANEQNMDGHLPTEPLISEVSSSAGQLLTACKLCWSDLGKFATVTPVGDNPDLK